MTTITAPTRRRTGLRRPVRAGLWWRPVAAWAVSRVVVLAAVVIGNEIQGTGQTLVGALRLWDGNWYIEAADGYDVWRIQPGVPTGQVDVAFFPVFPLLLRGFATITAMPVDAAGVVLNLLVGAVAVVLLWELVARCADEPAADRAALLFAFFPGSVLLSFVYSEPVMLVFIIGCMLALLERRWVLAGVLAALATATRPNALVICGVCAWAAAVAIARRRDFRSVVSVALSPLGFLAYMAWLWGATGIPDAWFRVQREGWGERIDFGAQALRTFTTTLENPFAAALSAQLKVVMLVVVVAGAVALWRWRPPAELWLYAAGIIILSLISWTLGLRPRFVFTAFPIVAALAWAARGWSFSLLLATSAMGSALLAVVYVVPRYVTP